MDSRKQFVGIKFREKGDEKRQFVIVHADSPQEAITKFWEVVDRDKVDVDKRTVAWAGAAEPLAYGDVLFLGYVDIDGVG